MGLDAGVDLGGGTVDLGLDTGVDLGGGSIDLGLDAGVDLGGGSRGPRRRRRLDLGGALDVGLDAGLDLGGVVDTSSTRASPRHGHDRLGRLDLGVRSIWPSGSTSISAAGTIDLGLGGGGDPAPAPAPPRGGLGGLLGGLL